MELICLFVISIYCFLAAFFFINVAYLLYPHKKPSIDFSFSNHAYVCGFKAAIRHISSSVTPPRFMAVLSDYYLTRKPYWTWLKRAISEQSEKDPYFVLRFFGLASIPAPDVYAWYCCIFHSYAFLVGSSSCHRNGDLTQWGRYMQDFLRNLLSYGVENRFIEKKSASDLLHALLNSEYSCNIPLVNKHVPSSYGNRVLSYRKNSAIGRCFFALIAAALLFAVTHEIFI